MATAVEEKEQKAEEQEEQGRTLVETETAGWFLDPTTGKNTRRTPVDRIFTKEEYQKLLQKVEVGETGKPLTGPTLVIKCVDCGKERTIKVQDKFQVERCVEHQKEHRNKLRREARARNKKKE